MSRDSEVHEFLSYSPGCRAEILSELRARSGKGPDAVTSRSGPAGATNAAPHPSEDVLCVPQGGEPRNGPFDALACCPLCHDALRADGACLRCKTQFVGIDEAVAARVSFTIADEATDAVPGDEGPPAYRQYWDVDEHGSAIICFQSRSTGWQVWLPCFMNYLDSFGDKQTRFPYWFPEQRFSARTVQTLCDLTDEQFKERAAHIPGRITSEHARKYDSDLFQRAYFWVWMEQRAPWQTRVQRKAIILHRHHRVDCKVPDCRKQHRGGRK